MAAASRVLQVLQSVCKQLALDDDGLDDFEEYIAMSLEEDTDESGLVDLLRNLVCGLDDDLSSDDARLVDVLTNASKQILGGSEAADDATPAVKETSSSDQPPAAIDGASSSAVDVLCSELEDPLLLDPFLSSSPILKAAADAPEADAMKNEETGKNMDDKAAAAPPLLLQTPLVIAQKDKTHTPTTTSSAPPPPAPIEKVKRETRSARRRRLRREEQDKRESPADGDASTSGVGVTGFGSALDNCDDFSSAWAESRGNGGSWGGRGKGGRAVRRQWIGMSVKTRDVNVDGVTLHFDGKELLARTVLRLTQGRCYALLGKNGVGKTTLLRRMASGAMPGFPPHLRVVLVAQESAPPATSGTVLDALLGAAAEAGGIAELDVERSTLEARLEQLGDNEDGDGAAAELEEIVERLGEIDSLLEESTSGKRRTAAEAMLKSLGFTTTQQQQIPAELSGGWRMRLSIACALVSEPDILLLDEPTNHLDLEGTLWLERYLYLQGGTAGATTKGTRDPTRTRKGFDVRPATTTVMIVSHDTAFVGAVATDVIVFDGVAKQLHYFAGTYADFVQRQEEEEVNHAKRLDARVRQETAARQSVAKMRKGAKHHTNLKQAKQKEKKLARIGVRRSDGHRYKTNSMSVLGKVREQRGLAQVAAKATIKAEQFSFPDSVLRSVSGDMASVVSLEQVSVAYVGAATAPLVLNDVTAQVTLKSRIAVVGPNGAGKTTLLKLILDDPALRTRGGEIRRAPGLRIGFVSQHHTEALGPHLDVSAAQYLSSTFHCSMLEARSRLGKFGLGGSAALQPMHALSGGQKVRVSLTQITWNAPHVLILDEPTNHLDIGGLDALAQGLRAFNGGVVLVSHHRAFCAAFCKDLWVVDGGKVRVMRGDDEDAPFAELFAQYAASVLPGRTRAADRTARSRTNRSAVDLDKRAARRRGRKGAETGGVVGTGFM